MESTETIRSILTLNPETETNTTKKGTFSCCFDAEPCCLWWFFHNNIGMVNENDSSSCCCCPECLILNFEYDIYNKYNICNMSKKCGCYCCNKDPIVCLCCCCTLIFRKK